MTVLAAAVIWAGVSCSQKPEMILPPSVTSPVAKRTFEKAKNNNIQAIRTIASYYKLGENGFPEDEREAANWYLLGAQQGDARCQYHIAMSYIMGKGRWPSYDKGAYWMRRAADNGHEAAADQIPTLRSFFDGCHGLNLKR